MGTRHTHPASVRGLLGIPNRPLPATVQRCVLLHEALRNTTAVTALVTDIITATLARDLPALVRDAIERLGEPPGTERTGTFL
jgi:hypothetical protein